jgi:hypothetical protein
MAIQEITVQFREDETHSSQTLTLDGVRFRLDCYTNKSDGSWYLDLFDDDDAALVQGIAIVTGLDLLFPYRHLGVPTGILFVNDLAGPTEDPGLDAFINRDAALYYQTADEALTSQSDF